MYVCWLFQTNDQPHRNCFSIHACQYSVLYRSFLPLSFLSFFLKATSPYLSVLKFTPSNQTPKRHNHPFQNPSSTKNIKKATYIHDAPTNPSWKIPLFSNPDHTKSASPVLRYVHPLIHSRTYTPHHTAPTTYPIYIAPSRKATSTMKPWLLDR